MNLRMVSLIVDDLRMLRLQRFNAGISIRGILTPTLPVSGCTLHVFRIPKGLSPPAQGCEERATLGVECRGRSNPERVAAPAFRPSERKAATTLSGLTRNSGPFPRVARPSQPWALGRNPFGILPRVPDSKAACKELSLPGGRGRA